MTDRSNGCAAGAGAGELTHFEALWIELWHYHDRQPAWSDME